MKTFVLFVYLTGGSNMAAVTSAEFNSQASCEEAKIALKDKLGGWGTSSYVVCVQK